MSRPLRFKFKSWDDRRRIRWPWRNSGPTHLWHWEALAIEFVLDCVDMGGCAESYKHALWNVFDGTGWSASGDAFAYGWYGNDPTDPFESGDDLAMYETGHLARVIWDGLVEERPDPSDRSP